MKAPSRGVRWTRTARTLHRVIGVALALIFTTLAVTGIFVSFKGQVAYLQPPTEKGKLDIPIEKFVPPAKIAETILAEGLPDAKKLKDIDRIELRPGKAMYKVRLKQVSSWSSPRELHYDATTGEKMLTGVRGDQLWMDLHSWAVFGDGTKIVAMTISGLALLWLVLSGIQMWAYPLLLRRKKAARVA